MATTLKESSQSRAESVGRIRPAARRLALPVSEIRALIRLSAVRPADAGVLGAAVADLLVPHSLEHDWAPAGVRRLLRAVSEAATVDFADLARHAHARAARDPFLLALAPPLALETQVRILYALAPVDDVSLWTVGPGRGPVCRVSVGRAEPTRRARATAREVLEGRGANAAGSLVIGVPVERWQHVEAALVYRTARDDQPDAAVATRETAAALAPVLEREALLARNAARERALVSNGERLMTRMGFDLHDGPMQDVAALAGDLRLLRRRVEERTEPIRPELVLGVFDDVEARVEAIDRALRELVHSLESPTVGRHPLGEVLSREVEAFRAQADIEVSLSLKGELGTLSASQRIALVRIVQESLSNARDHSGAGSVVISLLARADRVALTVTDDGRGFDVPRALVRAARKGRFGLLGMHERARLLGGRFDIESRPGGPTVVSAVLPAWQPALEQMAAQPAPTG